MALKWVGSNAEISNGIVKKYGNGTATHDLKVYKPGDAWDVPREESVTRQYLECGWVQDCREPAEQKPKAEPKPGK